MAAHALTVVLVAGLGVVGLSSPAWAEPPPPEIPQNASAVQLKYQPYMAYDRDGCYPSVAVGVDGALNPGLSPTGALDGSCRDASDLENSNMYARTRCNANGWCAHKYALYFQKDQTTPLGCSRCGHRHDWEHVVVWTQDDQLRYVAASAHGNYHIKPAADVDFSGTHPKIVYHKDGGSSHAFRFSVPAQEPEDGNRSWHFPDLVSWNGFPPGVRDRLTGHDWVAATLALKDENDVFRTDLDKARKGLTFEFNTSTNILPPGMPDPNTPHRADDGPADSLRVMGLGSSTTFGEYSPDGNGYRNVADRGLNDLFAGPGMAAAAQDTTPLVNWVGSKRVGTMPDREVEGWRGFKISEIAGKAQCAVKTYQPNLITLIAGGNDVFFDHQMGGAIGRLESLIKQVIADDSRVTVLVAGMQPFRDVGTDQRGEAFTAQIAQLAERLAQDGLRVVYTDISGLGPSDLVSDGVHPNGEGYRKIGEAFVKAARQAKDRGLIRKPHPQAPDASTDPCGMLDRGDGVSNPPPHDPNLLGPHWDDRGVIQSTQFPSTNRFWMVDVNKDGKAEFVTVDKDQNFRFWWNGGPSGKDWVPFVEGQNSYRPPAGAVGNMLRFADVDGDGFPDCLVVHLTGQVDAHTWNADAPAGARMCMKKYDGVASVFDNGSTGGPLAIDPTAKIRFADVTGGGRDDYLVIGQDGATAAWYNRGFQVMDGRKWLDWTPFQRISGPLENPREIRYADLNGDKRADRILITARGGARAWINEGPRGSGGTFRDIGRIAGDAEVPPKDIQFADLDADGKADFLRIGWTGVAHAWLNKLPPGYFDTFHP
ncbi:NPP1 family protein [Nonomuraea longicatena]|uniref:SGNH hydrolase-type esterase domain-containing protein n=1 Tax=Nonomuraea longicatena TaxID=83682 RepID=A0ABP4B5H3_9ACTN